MSFNEETGHLLRCNFTKVPNRGHNFIRKGCHGYNKNGETCGCQISKQSCDVESEHRYCNSVNQHWRKFCEEHTPTWDHHLSYCANMKCDFLDIDLIGRGNINQYNIKDILDLPSDYELNHVSDARRKAVDEEKLEESSSDNSESESESSSSSEDMNNQSRRKRRRTNIIEVSSDSESEVSECDSENLSEHSSDREFIDDDGSSRNVQNYGSSRNVQNYESDTEINFCVSCGKKRIEDSRFCHNCGKKF